MSEINNLEVDGVPSVIHDKRVTGIDAQPSMNSTKLVTSDGVVKYVQNILFPPPVYGYARDLTNSDPAACITYIDSNTTFSAAKMGSDTFDYGSWSDAWFMPKPCMLRFDGTVESYLNPNDYTKTTTGVASNIASSTTANAMMQWPIIYIYREYSGDTYKCHIASYKVNDNYKCFANINANGDIVPFYTSIYDASLSDNRYRSLSGQAPSTGRTVSREVECATANGSGWYTDVLVDRLLINDLLVLIGKNTNTQATFGMGITSMDAAQNSGLGNTKGLFWGDISGGNNVVKVFGMENWWGNVFRRTAGHLNVNGTQKIKLTWDTQDGSTTTGYNSTGDGYITLADSTPTAGYINSWVKSEYGLIPKGKDSTKTNSDSTFDCDYVWTANDRTTYALYGGEWNRGTLFGAFGVSLTGTPTGGSTSCGVALSYK